MSEGLILIGALMACFGIVIAFIDPDGDGTTAFAVFLAIIGICMVILGDGMRP